MSRISEISKALCTFVSVLEATVVTPSISTNQQAGRRELALGHRCAAAPVFPAPYPARSWEPGT